MEYSKKGVQLTESFEGLKLAAYQDQRGVWTLGYGHTLNVKPGQVCTQAQAEKWLFDDIAWAEREINWLVKVPLTQNEFDALVDFTFNAGAGNFRNSTLLKLVNEKNFAAAAEEFQKWDHCGGQVVAGLLRRRLAEEAEFKDA